MAVHLYEQLYSGFVAPDATAFRLRDGQVLTYGELDRLTARAANALIALGVRPGDRVAAQVEKSLDVVILYLGAGRAGGVFVPLNTAYTPAEISYFAGNAEPAVFFCDPESRESLASALCSVPFVETLGRQSDGRWAALLDAAEDKAPDVECGADDIAAILYTSGTTGRSKGAMLTHENLASNARTLLESWSIGASDTLIHALPIYHAHGLFVAINTLLMAGGQMIFLPQFDTNEVLAHLPTATCMMGVPTFYTRLLGHPGLDRERTSHMRLFVSGSAPLLEETHRAWLARTGHAILERYGMTETGMNTSNPYDGERVGGSVGLPLPGVELRVTHTDVSLPKGDIGMIEVRGPNVFKGYWQMEEATREGFRPDGFFVTGDLGRMDQRGYVHIVGRGKDLIITGGFNVYPKEVENEIDTIPGVIESAVIGLPHPDFGEGVTAIVVRDPAGDLTESLLMASLQNRLAKFKQPKRVIFAEDLPRNAMGKIQKNLLRDRFSKMYAEKASHKRHQETEL